MDSVLQPLVRNRPDDVTLRVRNGLPAGGLEGDGFELPVPREIAEACRRDEQTVGRWTRHLAPWRSSESDGPSVGAYVFNRPAPFASVTGPVAAPCQRVGPIYGCLARTGFPTIKAIISTPAIRGRLARWTPETLMPEKRTRSADQRQQYQPKDE